MKQINCEVSGVGFSINPLNNDYDEVVITSNFGLGESVVGGFITPDEYVVNILTKKIISQKVGTKDKIVKLNENKNETCILDQTEENRKRFSLNETILMDIVDNIVNIEKNYDIPIDIEFGVENNILYVLQARPITTYNKIPMELFTNEDEKRQLYFDVTLAIQGFEKPLSTLGSSILKIFFTFVGKKILGSHNFANIKKGAVGPNGGKLLLNISNILTKVSVDTLSGIAGALNKQLSEIVSKYGEEYKNEKVCHELNVSKIGMAWRLPIQRIIFYKFFAPSSKNNLDNALEKFVNDYDTYLKESLKSDLSILNFSEKIFNDLVTIARNNFIPVLFMGVARGYASLNKVFNDNFKNKPELKGDLNNLTRGLPYVTILMGLDLYKLSKLLDKRLYEGKSQEDFYQDFLNKKLPEKFYGEYVLFMKKYGFRGEGELDIENERYDENPRPILNQIYSSLLSYDNNNNPLKDYEETNAKRSEVFNNLKNNLVNKNDAQEFEEAFNNVINYFYYRESPKYYVIFALSKIKELILSRANILVEKNLINDISDIYKLNIESLNEILQKEKIYDQIKKDNELNEVYNSWKRTPVLFDSRGRILTVEKKMANKKNELIGETVSFGRVRGKAKVLNSVNEKEFHPGEILITKATDPGWTPLIINCGGIVLEVGGMLQHGALVSREFNKPCVVGVENVTNIVKDGEEVEVDAIEGVLRLLDRDE